MKFDWLTGLQQCKNDFYWLKMISEWYKMVFLLYFNSLQRTASVLMLSLENFGYLCVPDLLIDLDYSVGDCVPVLLQNSTPCFKN